MLHDQKMLNLHKVHAIYGANFILRDNQDETKSSFERKTYGY